MTIVLIDQQCNRLILVILVFKINLRIKTQTLNQVRLQCRSQNTIKYLLSIMSNSNSLCRKETKKGKSLLLHQQKRRTIKNNPKNTKQGAVPSRPSDDHVTLFRILLIVWFVFFKLPYWVCWTVLTLCFVLMFLRLLDMVFFGG